MRKIFLVVLLVGLNGAFAIQKEMVDLMTQMASKDTASGQPNLAVLPFTVTGKVPKEAGQTVAEVAVIALANLGKYKVVERKEFSKMIQEQEFAQSDLADTAVQIKLGKMLVCTRMLIGSVSEAFGQRVITAKIISVETGEVISSGTSTVPSLAMDDFTKELLGEKGQVSASIFRSLLIPGWGQFYTNHPVRGSISMAAVAGCVGYTVVTFLQAQDAKKKTDDFDAYMQGSQFSQDIDKERLDRGVPFATVLAEYEAKQEKLKSDYSDSFDYNMIWLGVTAGVWALNVVDATFAGLKAKKKFELYFSAIPAHGERDPFLASAEMKLAMHF